MHMYLMERVNSGLTSHQQRGHTKTGSRFNKTESAISFALTWSLFSEDLHLELILKSHPKDLKGGILIDLAISSLDWQSCVLSTTLPPLLYLKNK